MHEYFGNMVISLGLNCSTEDHFKALARDHNLPVTRHSGFFDWTIISFDSIIQFFERCKDGTIIDVLSNKDNYTRVVSDRPVQYPKNKVLDCVYIWHHETFNNESFEAKSIHKLETLLNYEGKRYFVINNMSNQIINNMKYMGEPPHKFIITYDQYNKIKALAKEVFDAEVILVSHREFTKDFPEDFEFRTNIDVNEARKIFGC